MLLELRELGRRAACEIILSVFNREALTNEYRRSKSIYFDSTHARKKKEIIVVTNMRANIIDLEDFSIDRIYNAGENRFGGHKPLIFDIGDIFGDPAALHFKLIKTL